MRWDILNKSKKNNVNEEIIKILLKNRGLKTKKQIEEFLLPTSPLELKPKDFGVSEVQITKAVKRIKMSNDQILAYSRIKELNEIKPFEDLNMEEV